MLLLILSIHLILSKFSFLNVSLVPRLNTHVFFRLHSRPVCYFSISKKWSDLCIWHRKFELCGYLNWTDLPNVSVYSFNSLFTYKLKDLPLRIAVNSQVLLVSLIVSHLFSCSESALVTSYEAAPSNCGRNVDYFFTLILFRSWRRSSFTHSARQSFHDLYDVNRVIINHYLHKSNKEPSTTWHFNKITT